MKKIINIIKNIQNCILDIMLGNFWKTLLSIFLFSLVFSVIFIIKTMGIKDYFVYPVEDFSNLETEAKNIVMTNDFNTNYTLEIKEYHNKNNNLRFELRSKEYFPTVSIEVTIKNYQKDNQSVTYIRNHKGELSYVFSNFRITIILSIIVGFILLVILCLTTLYLYLLSKFILRKINRSN